MSSSKLPSSTHGSISNQKRPTAKFHPCVWGDIFLPSPTTNVDAKTKLQHEELKEEVRRMIKVVMDDELLYKLRLIDTIKRLGVSYHFEREIEEVLLNIYEHDYKDDQTLETTLQFRLLRENGLGVPCEWFKKFKDDEGNFNMSLTSDVKGLLELYEASYLRVHGEDILEEALGFTTTHLGLAKAAGTIEYPLSALVSHALYQPIRKGLSRWKNGLDLATKLPFARDRLVEGYLWILGMYFEPQYSLAREILAKTIVMITLMDDIYDAYGTLEELQLLTNAVQRLDADYINQLPEYMKSFYEPLLDFYREMEEAMINKENQYQWFHKFKDDDGNFNMSLTSDVKGLLELYEASHLRVHGEDILEEALGFTTTHLGLAKASGTIEYPLSALVSHALYQSIRRGLPRWKNGLDLATKLPFARDRLVEGYVWILGVYFEPQYSFAREILVKTMVIASIMDDIYDAYDFVTPEIFNWASNKPKIIDASSIAIRLMNDVTSHKRAVECYMREHAVSKEEACSELKKRVENAWKDINQELIFSEISKVVPRPVLTRILNFTRVTEFIYKNGDEYTHVGKNTKEGITSLLIDPISVSY
ncbi:hypothetical protein GOBAR_DD27795 [Gossypium barbadense]|nr:hypothetical protein GOBAR_DD27795 [Gossypium barbadense]